MDFNKTVENKREFEIWLNKFNNQEIEANITGKITCICDFTYSLIELYRCYHCGLWLCPVCAKKHFGKRQKGTYTFKNYIKEKKNEKN